MARKEKRGLDYYNIETDIFQNRKIRRLLKSFGAKGYLVYSYLITEIYRDKGCFMEWDENTAFDVSDALNEKQSLVSEIVSYCCNVGLFNKELLTSENVLTAKNIQEFWVKVSKSAKRKCSDVDVRFNLVSSIGTVNTEESTLKTEFKTVKQEESTQSKVKESKVNKSIEEEYILQPLEKFIEEVKQGYHSQAIEQWYMELGLKKGSLTKLLTVGFKGQLLTSEKKHQNTSELKNHFKSWLNVLDRNGKLNEYKTKAKGAL